MEVIEFKAFPKIGRLSRKMVITEKLDGTNAQIIITADGQFATASRNRLITPEDDNYGFSRRAHANRDELMKLGPGRHFGEWWGQGIQRGYGLKEKRFSLFNVGRWNATNIPSCCSVVPTLYTGEFSTNRIGTVMQVLSLGSFAAPGFKNPEGIIIYHTANGATFKKTFDGDAEGKGTLALAA